MSSQPESGGQGFSLVMRLADPSLMPQLMTTLGEHKAAVRKALANLDYVHYARFLPVWDKGLLLVVTEFDGHVQDYVTDFAAVIGPQFDMILSYMQDHPPLPVATHTAAFWKYIERNIKPLEAWAPPHQQPFSAYSGRTVIEIVGGARRKEPFDLPRDALAPPDRAVIDDVQANVLRGVGARCVAHVLLRFAEPRQSSQGVGRARAFLRTLLVDPKVPVRFGVDDRRLDDQRQPVCANLGLTITGVASLGIDLAMQARFPAAFREGPEARAARNGDTGVAAPDQWALPPREATTGRAQQVDMVVSVWARSHATRAQALRDLAELCAAHGVVEVQCSQAELLDQHGTIHFGYVDRSGQPRVVGVDDPKDTTLDPAPSLVGDFVLGRNVPNSRHGYYIADLPDVLGTGGTYAALRVIHQDVDAFERLLDDQSAAFQSDDVTAPEAREVLAAKLMGRWRDGTPLVVSPTKPTGEVTNRFDYIDRPSKDGYEAPAAAVDDLDGRVCPMGSHVRRLNPRSGSVVGAPAGRRLIRRGMAYSPPDALNYDEAADKRNGLVGLFFCGDLEAQYEFILAAWANSGIAAPGLRGTHDPFTGHCRSTAFRIKRSATDPLQDDIQIAVPRLTRTVGSLYLFLPGKQALHWLAADPAAQTAPDVAARPPLVSKPPVARVPSGQPVAPQGASFNPADAVFRTNPDAAYRQDRVHDIVEIGGDPSAAAYPGYWVLSAKFIQAVLANEEKFPKPGSPSALVPVIGANRSQRSGLFFLNGDDHRRVRKVMDEIMDVALRRVDEVLPRRMNEVLTALSGRVDFVEAFATPLPRNIFMDLFGVIDSDKTIVDMWSRMMLAANDRKADMKRKGEGAMASLAMKGYLGSQLTDRQQHAVAEGSILDSLAAKTCPIHEPFVPTGGCPVHAEEGVGTASHFALGGYLSTEFFLVNTMRLLMQEGRWCQLREARRADKNAVRHALREVMRFEPPFQLADRWVAGNEGESINFEGFQLKCNRRVTLVYASANREGPGANPDTFDLRRYADAGHAAHFGFGGPGDPHHCIGAGIAMKVAQGAFEKLLDLFPEPRLDAVGPGMGDPYFRSRKSMHIVF